MKDIEMMTDHELLMELVAEKRREEKKRMIQMIFYLILFAVLFYFVFRLYQKVTAVTSQFDALSAEIDSLKQKAGELMERFSSADFDLLEKLGEQLQNLMNLFNRG